MLPNWTVDSSRQYVYLGDRLTRPELRGATCAALVRPNGKCITGRLGTMWVAFGGEWCNVLRRRLRKQGRG